jgi:zinc transporter ZupT
MIVFIAIMLHKAPAAFGLVSFLMHEGLERIRVRKHLIIFSFAAPLMAILTFIILKSVILTNLNLTINMQFLVIILF